MKFSLLFFTNVESSFWSWTSFLQKVAHLQEAILLTKGAHLSERDINILDSLD